MAWLQRLFDTQLPHEVEFKRDSSILDPKMGPGLTGQYDWALREKAGEHQPPILPQNMGLQGEFDQVGLAKRVAAAFDRTPNLQAIDTVTLQQEDCTIILLGSVASQAIAEQMIEVASQVDGTKAVNTQKLAIST